MIGEHMEEFRGIIWLKERIVFNVHAICIVGFTHDAFDIDIIKKEIENQKGSDNQDSNDTRPPLAKHFWFLFLPLLRYPTAQNFLVIAARYAPLSLCYILLVATGGLAQFGFIVIIYISDSTTENRCTNKQLATISMQDILLDTIKDLHQNLLRIIQLDFILLSTI